VGGLDGGFPLSATEAVPSKFIRGDKRSNKRRIIVTDQLVNRTEADGCATLTLNRPEKLNALSIPLFRQLNSYILRIEKQTDSIGLVVIRGNGRCFSAGNDLTTIDGAAPDDLANFPAEVVDRLANLPQPVIAAVHGNCYTGALELALAADLIIAADSAKFADTHSLWSMTPRWGMSQRLPRRVGRSKAMEMMFTSRPFSATEAVSMGLANLCVPDERFDDEIKNLAAAILKNSWFTHRNNKRLITQSDGLSLAAGLVFEANNSPGLGPDAQARMTAFEARVRK
jgi:enoyl-CoA hydratase